MVSTLTNNLADKNRGLSPIYGNLTASFCQTLLARDHLDILANILADKNRVYLPHYGRQNGISTSRTK
jgi:hypothetical protein